MFSATENKTLPSCLLSSEKVNLNLFIKIINTKQKNLNNTFIIIMNNTSTCLYTYYV